MRANHTNQAKGKKKLSTVIILLFFLFGAVYVIFMVKWSQTEKVQALRKESFENAPIVQKESPKKETIEKEGINLPIQVLVHKAASDQNKVVLLLQPSPVFPTQQLERLKTIDISWASWIDDFEDHTFSIIAAGPAFDAKQVKFEHMDILSLDAVQDKFTPFKNLIQSFFTIVSTRPLSWLVYGNDHSFVVPSNLDCFLRTLDPDLPTYSGNKLQRGEFHNFKLNFASGGAGCVVSHVSIKMFVLALCLNKNALVRTLLLQRAASHSLGTEFSMGQLPFSLVGDYEALDMFDPARPEDIGGAMHRVLDWANGDIDGKKVKMTML